MVRRSMNGWLVFIAFCSTGAASFMEDSLFQNESIFEKEVTNFLVHNGTVYVAGDGELYIYDTNLNLKQSVSTCRTVIDFQFCKNVNKVLLLNADEIILCGTGNEGHCETRNIWNIDTVKKSTLLKVSNDTHRPSTGIVTDLGDLLIANTYGQDLPTVQLGSGNLMYKYPFVRTNLMDYLYTDSFSYLLIDGKLVQSYEDFLIYFKSVLHYKEQIYFFTNQKNWVGDEAYLTKVIRLCQRDQDFSSYVDMPMNCEKDGANFNLLQDTFLAEGTESFLVGAFTASANPEEVKGGSLLCIASFQSIDEKLTETKIKGFPQNRTYLPPDIYKDWDSSICDGRIGKSQFYKYVAGVSAFDMDPALVIPGSYGYVTSLAGYRNDNNNHIIIAGTSMGYMLQISFYPVDMSMKVFADIEVHPQMPIVDFYVNSEVIFVMSKYKIAKYRAWTGSCEQYTTCDDVMESRQPYCGWCVYKNRSTNLQYCRDHEYIHPLSIGSCWSFVNNFSVIGERNRVDLKIKNFRENRIASNFTCRFLNGNEEPMTTVANVTRHGDVICESPNIQSYTELTLEFLAQMKDGETIGLIRATVALFKCQHLKRCGSCLETGSNCQWCSKSATCHPTGTCLDNSFVTKTQCPKIIGDGEVRYIPSGFPSPVRFAVQVSSMMDLHYLTCQIPSISPDIWPASIDRHNKIECTITIESDISDSNKTYDVVLKYGTAIFDVEGTPNDLAPVTVTVYRCENLGFDCHRCRSLNKTKYNCTWCESSGCAAIASGCSPASVCPAPVITAVKPQCGSTAGGTVVTLMGSELQALSAVSLAGKNCIMDDKATHTITDGTDDRVLCTSESLSHESSVGQMGHISYEDVSGKIFTANASFTYLEPIVQGIYPAFGPRSGETLVTIYGQNLWFGNMGITASLYDGYFHVFLKNCRTLEPGQEARTECNIFNSSMACRVPKPLYSIQNTDSLSLWFTNQSYSFSNIKFSFVDDPVILKISPKKAILSGGTEITVEGRNLNNSHTAVVSVDSYGERVEAGCSIYSAVKIICSSPTAPPSIKYNVKSLVTKGTDNHIRCKCLNVKASITLNGTFSEFDLQYYPDPELYPLTTDGDAVVLSDKEPIVTIMGKHLDSGVAKTDVTVKAGDLVCNLLTLTKTNMTCYLPRKTLLNSVPMNVTVRIGNLHWMVGRVRCKVAEDLPAWLKYTVAATTVVLLFGLGCLCVMVRMQKFRRKIRKFQREVQEKEIEIGTLTRTLKRKNIGSNDYNYIDMNELDPNEYFKLKRGKKEASEERDQNNEGTIETDHKYLAIGSKDLLATSQFDNDGDDENAGVDDIDSDYIHVRPDSLVVTVATIEKHEMGQEGEERVECDVNGPEELEKWPVGEPPST